MGAVGNANGIEQRTVKRKFPIGKYSQNRVFNGNHPPSILTMRPRLPPPGHLPPPRMGPPTPGIRPHPPFRGGPQLRPPFPPHNMMRSLRPHGLLHPGMRAPLPPPLGMRLPPGINMRPHMPPPMMGARRNFSSPMYDKRRLQQGKIIKRKRQTFTHDSDLNKPWVTEQVKTEFAKKDELLKIAKSTLQATDWATYRGQRDKCNKVYAAAKLEYIGQHPEEGLTMTEENVCNSSEEEDLDYNKTICNMCDREFQTNSQYRKHVSEHKVCGIDNCTFTAHEKVVEKHIEMQHCTGLYDRIKNVVTPEDISKWIADRKMKYPTKQNVEKRYHEQEEMLKRGERLKRNPHKFDRKNKSRFALSQKRHVKKVPKKRKVAAPSTSLIQEKSDWNGDLCPFRGTSELYQEDIAEEVEEFDDAEWVETEEAPEPSPISLNNALGSLMSAYNSGSDEDEAPVEQKISRVREDSLSNLPRAESEGTVNVKHKRKRKRVFRKNKPNTNNKKVKITGTNDESLVNTSNNFTIPIYRKRKVTLLERLLANEIIHERNVLLQCVRYVVSNNFFDKTTVIEKNNEVSEN